MSTPPPGKPNEPPAEPGAEPRPESAGPAAGPPTEPGARRPTEPTAQPRSPWQRPRQWDEPSPWQVHSPWEAPEPVPPPPGPPTPGTPAGADRPPEDPGDDGATPGAGRPGPAAAPWPQPTGGYQKASALPLRTYWPIWAALLALPIACCAGLMMPFFVTGDEDPADVPGNPCALVDDATLRAAVPSPKIARSEARNDYSYTKYGYCDVKTDPDRATTTAEASLDIEVDRSGSVGSNGPEAEAREDFAFDKKYDLSSDRVTDVTGLGEAAYLVVEEDSFDPAEHRVTVEVHALAGADRVEVRYTASPSNPELAAQAAVAVTRSLLKGLAR